MFFYAGGAAAPVRDFLIQNLDRTLQKMQTAMLTDPAGKVHPIIDYPGLVVDHSKTQRNWGVLKNIRVPIRPHFGTMGLAPKEADYVNSIPPSYTGGNIDNWRIGAGATMFYKCQVKGGLFSIGDPHVSQGDGEISGTAIESSLDCLFQIISHRYERGATLLTTNRIYKQWASIFNGDATLTSALLDRLLDHVETVVIEGKSYRGQAHAEA